MRRQDLIAFARRDWKSFAEMKERFRAEEKRAMSPGDVMHLAADLRISVIRRRPDWPSDEERADDLATHTRVSESLRRAGSTRSR